MKELNFIEFFNEFIKNTLLLEYLEREGNFDDIEDIFTLFNTMKGFVNQIQNF
jgi:hypothetical protein